jgi:hypothetical protein
MAFQQNSKFYIESKRRDMIEAANLYGINAKITIKYSQELDELLNQQWRLVFKNKEKKELNIL